MASQRPKLKFMMTSTNLTLHGPSPQEWLLPLLLVVSTESCSDIELMVRLAEVTVGCKDRPEMGWMTTLAGTVLSAV